MLTLEKKKAKVLNGSFGKVLQSMNIKEKIRVDSWNLGFSPNFVMKYCIHKSMQSKHNLINTGRIMSLKSYLGISITERGGWIDSATGHTKSDRSLLINGEGIHLTVKSEI